LSAIFTTSCGGLESDVRMSTSESAAFGSHGESKGAGDLVAQLGSHFFEGLVRNDFDWLSGRASREADGGDIGCRASDMFRTRYDGHRHEGGEVACS
jgi:hypothetical protein